METKKMNQLMNSYTTKMLIVAFLAILLMIPTYWVMNIIKERIAMSEEVKRDLHLQWGSRQVIAGPVLNLPYTYLEEKENGQGLIERQNIAHFLPETLNIDVNLNPSTRKRGIYKVVVYEGQIKINGTFVQPDLSAFNYIDVKFLFDKAYFTVGISDLRGIKNLPELNINNQKYKVEPGVADNHLFNSGITIKAGTMDLSKPFNFEMNLVLNGSEDLSVEPLGKTSEVFIKSSWPNPSFNGGFLPVNRQINKDGFNANWVVTHLNRNFPQQWVSNQYNTHDVRMGVELMVPVDHYQIIMRSVKYAILFIALNFIVFLFIEIRNKTRIHPFQYSLVAFALLIFYVLLTSISEQLGFNYAFLISSIAVIALISWYSNSILQNRNSLIWITILQTGLYVFLFTILQLQDYALLAGSIGLFLILAIIMKASLKIRWYSDNGQ